MMAMNGSEFMLTMKKVREAYNRARDWFETECENGNYCESQKLMIYRFNLEADAFEVVNLEELE